VAILRVCAIHCGLFLRKENRLFKVDFEPIGRRGRCPEAQSLLECARSLDVDIVSICGGMGVCHRCRVQVVSGTVSELTAEEKDAFTEPELKQNYRLACQTRPLSNVKINVPPESLTAPQRTQVEGLELEVEPEPPARSLSVKLDPPSLGTPKSDDQNLWAALEKQHGIPAGNIDLATLRALSSAVRDNGWQARVALRDGEIVALGRPDTRWFGLAVDIGTTKIAAYLIDMESGKTVSSKGLMNPQISYGEDIIARIFCGEQIP